MRYKFSSIFILAIIALSVLTTSAQTYWERSDRKDDKQKRKQTVVRTIDGRSEVIITTPDQVIVRPAVRANIRPIVVRPVPPRPPVPVMRANARIWEKNNYSADRNIAFYSIGNYENNRYESNRFGNVAEVARLNGYRDGAREGAKDARDGDRYDPFGGTCLQRRRDRLHLEIRQPRSLSANLSPIFRQRLQRIV